MKPLPNLSACLLFVLSAAASAADRPPGPPPGGHPKGPPPEAIAACSGKTEGTQASLVDRSGVTRTGICMLFDGVLALSPPDMPPGGASRPAR